ncbi:MAG: ferric reductase-like transmembrane domain-containing protein [Melioribacteraceae bacterium]|nr:ferric reductase-like transmembrane domain-containing protein [Melioribacteraceae bacterium]
MKKYNLTFISIVFLVLPIFLLLMGDFKERTLLKDSISILTIIAFCLMSGQLFLNRNYRKIRHDMKMSSVVKIHKFIGYSFLVVLLVHPFLIVVPRFFESGVEPIDAFMTIITTFNSLGVILGIIAWCLLLVLGITSMFRNKLKFSYKTWRVFHGILAFAFIVFAVWHVIDLGRHINFLMSVYLIAIAFFGIVLLLNTYLFNSSTRV